MAEADEASLLAGALEILAALKLPVVLVLGRESYAMDSVSVRVRRWTCSQPLLYIDSYCGLPVGQIRTTSLAKVDGLHVPRGICMLIQSGLTWFALTNMAKVSMSSLLVLIISASMKRWQQVYTSATAGYQRSYP